MTIVTGRHVCASTYPDCIAPGVRLIQGIPLCEHHYWQVLKEFARPARQRSPQPAERFYPWESVVYYVTWPSSPFSQQVKIGYSANLRQRLTALRRKGHAPEVLVAELGDRKGEFRRHRQFSSVRLLDEHTGAETEFFRLSPQLGEHITQLQEMHPDWVLRSRL